MTTIQQQMPPQIKTTPMMAQWHQCKIQAKTAILFFRMGDFYEVFYDDATLVAKELNLTLTQRQGIPMAGVPYHSIDNYIDKLVQKGHRIAIAEQTSDPKKSKGLLKREIVRTITPGTLVNSSLLGEKANNFFTSFIQIGTTFGLAYLDLTTSEFRTTEFDSLRDLLNELYRLRPSEILTSVKFKEKHPQFFAEFEQSHTCLINVQEEWHFTHEMTYPFLIEHFKVHNLNGFGLRGKIGAINAAGAMLNYIKDELSLPIHHIKELTTYSPHQFMVLDRMTQRNLELTESLNDNSRKNTLLEILDHTSTPMGGRLIRQWIKQPLMKIDAITKRQDSVEILTQSPFELQMLKEQLDLIRDLERLIMKIAANYASPKDIAGLRFSLEPLPHLRTTLEAFPDSLIQTLRDQIQDMTELTQYIAQTVVDDPPLKLVDGGIIRDGYNSDLDELRSLRKDSKKWMVEYQNQLKEKFNVKTLKVAYNRVFGYYIEVSKGQAHLMPESFQRRQTLTNSERFISPELKIYEEKVLNAEEKIQVIETEIFSQVREEVANYHSTIQHIAQAIAHLDCLQSLATCAKDRGYTRPKIDDSSELFIREGRHPVIECSNVQEAFIPNDTHLNSKERKLMLITGPNMAGKSTYIRQTALLTIMTQMGSFIPAKEAHIGVVDKVFTRIGASDDLSRGQSTFMVEMTETANILHHATSRSLIILDEIGRGTSTYDGISIAWAVAEYLLTAENKKAKTLFATHYWELTQLEEKLDGAFNAHISVQEIKGEIIFLRKVKPGGADKSYGIQVARLAGLPSCVIKRAQTILQNLERQSEKNSKPKSRTSKNTNENQLLLFDAPPISKPNPVLEELKGLTLDTMSPLEALSKLFELQQKMKIASP